MSFYLRKWSTPAQLAKQKIAVNDTIGPWFTLHVAIAYLLGQVHQVSSCMELSSQQIDNYTGTVIALGL